MNAVFFNCGCVLMVCLADTNLVLEARQEPLAVDWRGPCAGFFLRSHHWPKHMLMTQIGLNPKKAHEKTK